MKNTDNNYFQVLNRIIDLLNEKGLQQKDLCAALNLKNGSFTEWKAGRNTSYMKKLPEIANYFNVSVDHLLGYEQEVTGRRDTVNKEVESKHQIFCSALHTSDSRKALEKILNEQTSKQVADIVNTLLDKKESPFSLTEGEMTLLNLFRQVPEDQQELVLQMIKAALGKM